MSLPTLSSIAGTLKAALVEASWAQWSAIEGWAAGKPARSVVDPEALVLTSLWLESEEPRLWRVARVWARGGARYLSVQRMKNLAAHYPKRAQDRLGDFAWECWKEGKDARWRPLARKPSSAVRERGRELAPSARFEHPAALLLRLRIGLGVGIKADVLAYLLGSAGARRTLREITFATVYHRRAVNRAVEELVVAGFIVALATAPASYRADLGRWEPLLQLGKSPPIWWEWDAICRFVGALDDAAQATRHQSLFLQASRARDVLEAHYLAFDLNGVPVGEVTAAPGENYLTVLEGDVKAMAERVRKNFV
jgi:hypothetical protein